MSYRCVDCGVLMGGEHSNFDEGPTWCEPCLNASDPLWEEAERLYLSEREEERLRLEQASEERAYESAILADDAAERAAYLGRDEMANQLRREKEAGICLTLEQEREMLDRPVRLIEDINDIFDDSLNVSRKPAEKRESVMNMVEINPETVYAALKMWQKDVQAAQHAQDDNRCASIDDPTAGCTCYSPKDDDGNFQRLAEEAGIWSRF